MLNIKLTSVGPFTFMDPFTLMGLLSAWGPFASVWPFYTYIGLFTTTWGPSLREPPSRRFGVVCAGSAQDAGTPQ